jgi:hypothetical protein
MITLRKTLGLVWLCAGPALLTGMMLTAASEIKDKPVQENYLFWGVMLFIFTPIMAGLSVFGWYAWRGEYEK